MTLTACHYASGMHFNLLFCQQTCDGIIRVLRSSDPHLLHRMVGVVERLLESSDYQEDVRLLGGIPLLLDLLR